MRDLANPRGGRKQFGVVLALSLVLAACVGTLLWLVWSDPDGLPASGSEGRTTESASVPDRLSQSSVIASSSKSESSQGTASSAAPPPARPVQHTGVSAGTGAAQKLQNLTINAALTHDENATYYNVYINAGGVTLKNKLVTGDLVLSESVGNGAVTLENIVVKGRILVNGAQTVTLSDVTAVQIIAQRGRGTTDYVVVGASTIHQMTAKNHLSIDEGGLSSNYAGVKKLAAEPGTPMWQQVTLLKGALEQVTTNDAANLILSNGSSVDTVLANAPTHIRGGGLVYNLTVRSNEVSYERKPRNVTVEGRYSEPNEQNWAIGETEMAVNGGSHTRTVFGALATPRNLTITAAEVNSVTLAFDRVDNASGYTIIYWVTDGTDDPDITEQTRWVNTNICAITDALIGQAGATISFKVRADSGSAHYTASNYSEVCTRTVLGQPTNLQLTPDGNKLSFSFTAAANAVAGTHEAVLSVDDTTIETLTLDSGVSSGTFENPQAGKTNIVTVRAVGDGRLTLSSSNVTESYEAPSEWPSGLIGRYAAPAVPKASTVRNLAISSVAGDLAVTFTGVSDISDYSVTLRYDGTPLDALSHSADGDVYTYLFEKPGGIEDGKAYIASAMPQGGQTSTASRTVARRDAPQNLRIASLAPGSVIFAFDTVSGRDYGVVSATQNGVAIPGITAADLTATALTTVAGDRFNFSVKTLGDGMFYADSQTVSAAEVTVIRLSEPISPFFGGNQGGLTLHFSTTNSANAHILAVQTSQDGGSSWSEPAYKTVAAGGTQAGFSIPPAGTQVKFSVTAKAATALQADSNASTSPVLSVIQLDAPTGLEVVDLNSGQKARFQFDAGGADSYTVSYRLSNGADGSIGPCDHATAISTPVALGSGITVDGFTVAAHAAPDSTHFYLDSTARYAP